MVIGSPPFISQNKAIWKGNNPILMGLTITMVIKHLLTGMILQVGGGFSNIFGLVIPTWGKIPYLILTCAYFSNGLVKNHQLVEVFWGVIYTPGKISPRLVHLKSSLIALERKIIKNQAFMTFGFQPLIFQGVSSCVRSGLNSLYFHIIGDGKLNPSP